jgi:hypothetical protein
MPITIPQIKRTNPVGQESIGRITTNYSALQEAQSKPLEIISKTVSKVADNYVEQKQKAQESYDKLKSKEFKNLASLEMEEQVAKFKNLPAGADPTQHQKDLEKSMIEITQKYRSMDGLNNGIRVNLESDLSDLNVSYGREIIVTNAHKGQQWKQSVLNTTSSNLQSEMNNTVLLTDFTNPASVDQAKRKLDEFTALYSDPANIETMGDKSKILDKRGKAVDQTVQSLLAIRNIKGAEAWLQLAGSDISSEIKTTTYKKIEDAKNEVFIASSALNLLNKNQSEANKEIQKYKKTNPVVGDRIEQAYFNNLSQRSTIRNNDIQSSLNLMTIKMTEMRNNGTLPVDQEAARKDPAIAQILANVKDSNGVIDEKKIQSALRTAGVGFDVSQMTPETRNELNAAVRTGDISDPVKYNQDKIKDLMSRLPVNEQKKLLDTIEKQKNGDLSSAYQNQILDGVKASIQASRYQGKNPQEFNALWNSEFEPQLKILINQTVKNKQMNPEEIYKLQKEFTLQAEQTFGSRLKNIKVKGKSERSSIFRSSQNQSYASPSQFSPANADVLKGKSLKEMLEATKPKGQ